MRMTELQRIVMLSSGTLTGAIDRMERAGLVRRVADADDGRAWRIEPAAPDGRPRRIEDALESDRGGLLRRAHRQRAARAPAACSTS
jgi:hypothetical protein